MNKAEQLLQRIKEKGIPVLVLEDPLKKQPSVTFTMMAVAFLMCLLGLIGKTVDMLGGINFADSLELLKVTGLAYLGRQWMKKGDVTNIEENK